MPENPRGPLFTEGQIRAAFFASAAGMVAILVILLLLSSARPQGRTAEPNTAQFDATLRNAGSQLGRLERVGEDGARMPIDRAMEVVAERGVDIPLTAAAQRTAQEEAGGGEGDAPPAGAAEASADGAAVYAANCAGCHGAEGAGVPGAFPPLAGNVPELAGAEGGRTYLAHAVLHGIQGPLEVDGQTYDGVMPAWGGQLGDAEIAAVLNHVSTAWGGAEALPADFEPFGAEEVAAERDEPLAPTDVLELRP